VPNANPEKDSGLAWNAEQLSEFRDRSNPKGSPELSVIRGLKQALTSASANPRQLGSQAALNIILYPRLLLATTSSTAKVKVVK
jgi:hypothetical protein